MSTTTNFKDSLATTIKKLTLDGSNWKSEEWKTLGSSVTQEILNEAFSQHGVVLTIFSCLGKTLQRKCKLETRVKQKINEQQPQRKNYFKVVADYIGIRVLCEVRKIRKTIDYLREITLANHGMMYVRGSSTERPYGGFVEKTGKYCDISQFVYVYLYKIGYIVEFQILHEFAANAFTINSIIRDNPNCGQISLLKDHFYEHVKMHIIDKANQKEDLIKEAEKLHGGAVPDDLHRILAKL